MNTDKKMSNPVFKIIPQNQGQELLRLVERCNPNDVHSHPDYINLFSAYMPAEGFYAFYGDEDNYVLTPYFKKILPASGCEKKYFDLISPWYYGGPIYHAASQAVALAMFKNFKEELDNYCRQNNIVSEFQRLNPAIDNYLLYQDDPNLFYNRNVVYIDLNKPMPQIRSEYAYKVRKRVKQAERAGLRLVRSKTQNDLEKFIEVYLSTVRGKGLDSFYYFNNDFFTKLLSNFQSELEIFRAEYQGKTIAANIVFGKHGILHNYLSGSLSQYLSLRPNDFINDQIVSWAKENGYCYLSLGGGITTAEDDSVFHFKKSFSSTIKKYYLYKKVHNAEKYKQLCLSSGKNESELLYEKASFFPEYPQT